MENSLEELKQLIISSNYRKVALHPTNHPNFTEYYRKSVKVANISCKNVDTKQLLQKCSDLYEYMKVEFSLANSTTKYILPTNVYQKVQIFNKAINIYLTLNKNYNIYSLAQIVSFKSGLTDLYGIIGARKYIVIEFELYKFYIISYLLAPNSLYEDKHLCEAAYWVLRFSRDGIIGYVNKAHPSQILCAAFIYYYFSNSQTALEEFITTYKNTPSQNFITDITADKETLLKQCIVFMLTDKHAVSTFTKEACALDLSLIEPTQDYKKLYNTTIEEA